MSIAVVLSPRAERSRFGLRQRLGVVAGSGPQFISEEIMWFVTSVVDDDFLQYHSRFYGCEL